MLFRSRCNDYQFARNTVCHKCGYPKHATIHNGRSFNPSVNKPMDWNCPKCNMKVFASKKFCFKCRVDKEGNIVSTLEGISGFEMKTGDWNCPACGDYQFARNKACRKCRTPKSLLNNNVTITNIENTERTTVGNEEDDNTCRICWDQPSNMLLLHEDGKDGHKCCCQDCAAILIAGGKDCPICRKEVIDSIRVY